MHIVGRFMSFLACCRSFQVVSGRFLLAVSRFRLFQVVPRFSKHHDVTLKKTNPQIIFLF